MEQEEVSRFFRAIYIHMYMYIFVSLSFDMFVCVLEKFIIISSIYESIVFIIVKFWDSNAHTNILVSI